jgi:hypothetical protein
MMRRLIIKQAAAAPLRYALDNNESYKDPTTGAGVHGLVRCRRDLTTEDCTKCLNDVVQHLLDSYLNHTAATLRGLSCYAKYHHEPITLMTVPEPPPDADPAGRKDLPLLPTQQTKGWKDNSGTELDQKGSATTC